MNKLLESHWVGTDLVGYKRAADVEYGDVVRAEGWSYWYESLGVQEVDLEFAKVLWQDNGPHWIGPFTWFPCNETVEVKLG